jgi:hypothetical protein
LHHFFGGTEHAFDNDAIHSEQNAQHTNRANEIDKRRYRIVG